MYSCYDTVLTMIMIMSCLFYVCVLLCFAMDDMYDCDDSYDDDN